jgi:hypothetical protein
MYPRLFALLFLLSLHASAAPKRLLLIGQGPDGHPPSTHEFMGGVRVIEALMKPYAAEIQTTITKADEPWTEGPALLDQADGVVLMVTQGSRFMQSDPARYAAFQRLTARKGALVALHWSIGAYDAAFIPGQLALLGGTRGGPQRKYKVLENDVHLADPTHPILRGLTDFRINDEFYYRLDLASQEPGFHPLLKTIIDGQEEVVSWALERTDGGRSFGYVGFHFHKNWERLEYRRLVTQAILWSFDLPIPEKGAAAEVDPKVYELPPRDASASSKAER